MTVTTPVLSCSPRFYWIKKKIGCARRVPPFPALPIRCVSLFARWHIGPFLQQQLEEGGEGRKKLGSEGEFSHIQSVIVFLFDSG